MLFWISLALVGASAVALYIFVALYVWNDAKVRSESPLLWLLISMLVPNFLGFICYLLVGRTKKAEPKKHFLKPIIAAAIVLVLSTATFITNLALNNDLPMMSGVSIGMVTNNFGSNWEVSYKTSGERFERKVTLNEDELQNFVVSGKCESGSLMLLANQGTTAVVFDITDFPAAPLDLSAFHEGTIYFTLTNDEAKNAEIKIHW